MITLVSLAATVSNIATAFIRFYPILKTGLVVAGILTTVHILLKVSTEGISSVTGGQWAQTALIAATVLLGKKIAGILARNLITRALQIPPQAMISFKAFGNFIESEGVLLEIDNMIVYTEKGLRVAGEFDLIEIGSITKPIIILYEGGHTVSTLLHEYVHYRQWKYFVGALSPADWQNFSNIKNYRKSLEEVAYFISNIFEK
jgi:hypothetical protein